MGGVEDSHNETGREALGRPGKARARSPSGIAEQNAYLLRRYQEFRRAADAVAAAWRGRPEVERVALMGSLAIAPWKEVPRFAPYRRARIELWHEVKDIDLAVWLTHLRDLNALRRAKDRALHELYETEGVGVASHQVDIFLLEFGTDRYLGRLCQFNSCPKAKSECQVPGCGATKFLRQHEGFQWRPESIAEERMTRLFERATGQVGRATDLPLPVQDGGTLPGQDPKDPAV